MHAASQRALLGGHWAARGQPSPAHACTASPPAAAATCFPAPQGEVVQVVLQNLPANANNGDYRIPGPGASRNATEQHPFHLHGHHFWARLA